MWQVGDTGFKVFTVLNKTWKREFIYILQILHSTREGYGTHHNTNICAIT
jgi:hypothetical protein